jgi:hypothetical protein
MVRAWESLHLATLELVRSTPIKQRLVNAYRRHLAGISAEQLPQELRDPFGRLLESLRGVQPQRGEDAVTASVRKMSCQEADECAATIVELFGLLCRPQLVQAPRPTAVVQLHTVDAPAAEFDVEAMLARN